jgi:hypothetical protein
MTIRWVNNCLIVLSTSSKLGIFGSVGLSVFVTLATTCPPIPMHPNDQELGHFFLSMGHSNLSVRLLLLVAAHGPYHSHFTLLATPLFARVGEMQHSLWGKTRERWVALATVMIVSLNVAIYGFSVGLGRAYASNPPTYR